MSGLKFSCIEKFRLQEAGFNLNPGCACKSLEDPLETFTMITKESNEPKSFSLLLSNEDGEEEEIVSENLSDLIRKVRTIELRGN